MTPLGFFVRVVLGFIAFAGFVFALAILQHCLEGRHPR
jgi:hypothetical protein